MKAFESLKSFEQAQLAEIREAFSESELQTLGRLLKRGRKLEIEVFTRTHGPNPLFDPQGELDDIQIDVAKADRVDLLTPARPEANKAVLEGQVVHVLFQAGEATRFQKGPFYRLNPIVVSRELLKNPSDFQPPGSSAIDLDILGKIESHLKSIDRASSKLPAEARSFLLEAELGPKQMTMIRAALRRIIQDEIEGGRLPASEAPETYRRALANQKMLFFVTPHGNVNDAHDQAVRQKNYFGFNPENLVTIAQELVHGIQVDEDGRAALMEADWAGDAAGHLYSLLQAARAGGFHFYSNGEARKREDMDALTYLQERGARFLNIIRINDMDRHTTEIINAKALSYALAMFERGYVNVIEGVANPEGQKGGTGTLFNDPDIHVLTETHENSFPLLSRAFEKAMQRYLENNQGHHPAYNAMRQWADLKATRQALQQFGGRLVFVPRQKEAGGQEIVYLGADMPMGDLSLLCAHYKSRMFQFTGPQNRELLIHDMKKVENLPIALRTIERQMEDPQIVAASKEVETRQIEPFSSQSPRRFVYGAPTPEFDG